MIIIATLTIVAFILLYNTRQIDELANLQTPKIYGRALNPAAIDRQVKNYQLTLSLGQFDLMRSLGGMSQDREMALTEFVWNLLVLQHKAHEMGIEPTDDRVAERIKAVPLFQTNGQFDPAKYSRFVAEQLAPRGFSERQLEEVMRDALRLEGVQAVVESPVALGADEIKATARIFQPVTASVVKFERGQADQKITINPQEIASTYEQNKSALVTPETRAIRYVAFEIPKDKSFEGKEKTEALQKLANAASAVVDSLAQEGITFAKAAEKTGAKTINLPAFDNTGNIAKPDAAQESSARIASALAPAAFLLTGAGKTSDVIQVGDAFYVFELTEVNPPRAMTLDESKSEIENQLRAQKSAQIFNTSTASAFSAIKTSMASGKSFEAAVAAQNLKTVELAAVVPAGESTTSEQQLLTAATMLLKEGEISNLEQAPWGAFAVQLIKRGEVDSKNFSSRETELRTNMLRNKKDLLFAEWLRASRIEAKISVPQGRRSRG